MTTYLPRSAWTTTAPSGDRLARGKVRGVAVHWPGTTQNRIGASRADIAARLRSYRNYHVNTKGWRDIGYNLAIDQAGRIWACRTVAISGDIVGAHCASPANPDANEEYVGVLLLLGDEEEPTEAMVEAFWDWYQTKFLTAYPGRTDVRGHGQVPGAQTACPGPHVRINQLTTPQEDDHMTPEERKMLEETHAAVTVPVVPSGGMLDRWPGLPEQGYTPRVLWRTGYWNARANGEDLAKVLANQKALMAAQGVEVDAAELGREIAAVLVPAVMAELSDAAEEEIEATMDRVLRRVLGSLDETT